jgi:hypothetical protein
VGYDADGKRRRRTVYGPTKDKVRNKLTEVQSKALLGCIGAPSPDRRRLHEAMGTDPHPIVFRNDP